MIGFKKSLDAASNLTEAINATRVTFKQSADDVLKWSKTTATAMGISQRAALEAAAGFGNMLNSSGLARDESAKMSKGLVQLAADMSSLHNVDPSEMLVNIRSALAGEAEPLRRYGVLISEAKVQTEGLRMGLVKKGETLNDTGKMLARYALIMRESSAAHGDAAKTIGEEAGSRRVFNALIEESAAKLGKVFLPAVTSARKAVNDWLGDKENQKRLEQWAETLEHGVATALRGIARWVKDNREQIVTLFRDAKDAAVLLGGALGKIIGAAGNVPFGLLGAASAAVILRKKLLALSGMQVTIPILLATMFVNEKNIDKANKWVNENEAVRDVLTGLGLWNEVEGREPNDPSPGKPVGDSAADKAGLSSRGANLSAKFGGLQAGTTALAGFVQSSGGTITAGREGGHSPTGGHGVGQSLDISWANNGPTIWAALFPHRAKFRLLLGPPGLYMWGQQYQNARDAKNHRDHIHVQYQGSAAELRKLLGDKAPEITGATGIEAGYGAIDTGADTSTSGTGGAGAKKAGIDSGDLSRAQSKASWIEGHADLITSPTLRARIRQRGLKIAEILGDVTDPKEFARAKRNLAALDRDFENAVKLTAATKQAKATAKNIGTALGRMPEAMQKEMGPRLAAVNKALGNVTSKGQLAKIVKELDAMNKAIAAGLETMKQTVERGRDTVGRALGSAADKALQVLDAKTEELIRKARAAIGDLAAVDETAEGRTLRLFREGRTAGERGARSASLLAKVAGLEGALARKPDETDAELAAREKDRLEALAEAREAVRQDDFDAQERALEEAASIADAARDKERERQQADIDKQRDAAEAAVRDQRAILKERFQGRYEEIVRGFQNETLTAEQAQQQLLALLGDPEWAADFANAGALIGAAFASSFETALSGLAAAVDALRDSLNELAAATGQPQVYTIGTRVSTARRKFDDAMGFAAGGRVPGRYVGREDTVMARLTPGETVIDRGLTAKLEAALDGGGLGGGTPIVDLRGSLFLGANKEVAEYIGRELASSSPAMRHMAAPMSDEQARIIGYRHQRA